MAASKRLRMSGSQQYMGGGGQYHGGDAGGFGGPGAMEGFPSGYGGPSPGFVGPGGNGILPSGAGGFGSGPSGPVGGSMGMGMDGGNIICDSTDPASYVGEDRSLPAVKLRGLPFQCNEDDIRIFLVRSCRAVLVYNRPYHHSLACMGACYPVVWEARALLTSAWKHGRFSGEAFVVLGQPMHVDFALQKNKMHMGRRYVEVFRAKRWVRRPLHDNNAYVNVRLREYYRAVAAEVMEDHGGSGYHELGGGVGDGFIRPTAGHVPGGASPIDNDNLEHTGVLKLRGLPFSATADDIVRWFVDPSITLSGPVLAEK
eukprot:scaffold62557_cov49-Prasinocladus_malaysianus.AAC.1